ncbi:MAG: hypothetical protein NZL88_01645, partial [Gaiellaceae bacterium]|nr:hypothetical protein [Gaiellaceae bacterium]
MSLPPGVGSPTARWLFSQHFLEDRVPGWPELASLDTGELYTELRDLWRREAPALEGANEGETEERLIRPVLRALGHSFQLFLEIPGTGKTPDYFLYRSEGERAQAERLAPWARIERAIAVGDAKRFDLPL